MIIQGKDYINYYDNYSLKFWILCKIYYLHGLKISKWVAKLKKKKAPLFGNICTQFLLFFFFSSYWPIHPNIHHLLPSQPQVPSPSTTISTPLFISPMSPLANVIQPNHLFHFEPTLSCNLRRYQVYLSKISTIYDQNRLNITENIKLNEMANIDRI